MESLAALFPGYKRETRAFQWRSNARHSPCMGAFSAVLQQSMQQSISIQIQGDEVHIEQLWELPCLKNACLTWTRISCNNSNSVWNGHAHLKESLHWGGSKVRWHHQHWFRAYFFFPLSVLLTLKLYKILLLLSVWCPCVQKQLYTYAIFWLLLSHNFCLLNLYCELIIGKE